MESKTQPVSARIQNSFQKLAKSAANLNAVSDELGKSITQLDDALKRLNLGVPAWVEIHRDTHPSGHWNSREIGYAKIGGKWGIALGTSSGYLDEEQDTGDSWLFNDAPRWLRLLGIKYLPDLIEKLIEETDDTTERIRSKIAEANELASAIHAVAPALKGKA